jgi:type II restriction enzyme
MDLEIDDYFMGVQVGLETHRRKNVGGRAFSIVVENKLLSLVKELNRKGFNVQLTKEEKVYFSDKKTSKTLDFCLHCNGKNIGIEVNFYTASGSKPTEIKRSYGHVNKELEKNGTTLVWITDGAGYYSMRKSLKEARDIHANTYNLKMMKRYFEEDIINFFNLK